MHDATPVETPQVDAAHPALRPLIAAGFPADRIAQVMACYDEPQRCYHGRAHLREMLDLADELCLALSPAQALALLYHDAVYVPGAARGGNEQLSAQLLRVQGAGMAPALIELACSIVVDTAEHLASSAPARLVIDLDLLRLAGPAERFDFYSRQVFAEPGALFGESSDEAAWLRFQQRRVPFFRRLLGRPAIFMTPPIHARFEETARQNLAQALVAAGASV